ncbi:MAG: SDR family NAD(P)-dependent oxidoreductase [Chloroflexota bacterium]
MSIIDLTGKVVIVTGGAQGIGRSIVQTCATAGANVIIADLQAEKGQESAKTISEETGQHIIAIQTDITELKSVQQMVSQTMAELGQIDILVNNAGWDRFHFFMDSTPDFWNKVIDINYKGMLNACYATLPHMIAQKSGAIVSIASDAGRGGSMGEAVYGGCKGAVIAFSKTIAREHARDNIRVNVVAPGITDTAILAGFYDTEMGGKVIDAVAKMVPLGRRAGQPEEIAPTVAFLASEAARYITGQVLSVNGGLTMMD